MNAIRLLVLICVAFGQVAVASAQELPPPPPPPDVDSTEQDTPSTKPPADDSEAPPEVLADEPEKAGEEQPAPPPVPSEGEGDTTLGFVKPVAGSEVGTSTTVEATAKPGSEVELLVDGTIEKRLRVDATGRFTVALSDLTPNSRVRLELQQFDSTREVESSTSLVVRTGPPSPKLPNSSLDRPVDTSRSLTEEFGEPPATEPIPVAPRPMMSQGARGAISTLAGTAAGGVGLFAGFFGGAIAAIVFADGDGDFSEIGWIFTGALVGYGLAVPAGVYLSGYLLDGNGSLLLTSLATIGGLFAGLVILSPLAMNSDSDLAPLLYLVSATLIGAGTGALVFELTSDPSRRVKEFEERGVTIVPTVAPASREGGLVVGLGGTF
jgi:hypothetical protein